MTHNFTPSSVVPRLLQRARSKVADTHSILQIDEMLVFENRQKSQDDALLAGILSLVGSARIYKCEAAFHLQAAAWTIERPLIGHMRKMKAVLNAVDIVLRRAESADMFPLTGNKEVEAIGQIATFLTVNGKPNDALMLLNVLETQQQGQDPESPGLISTRKRQATLIANQVEGASVSPNHLNPACLPRPIVFRHPSGLHKG